MKTGDIDRKLRERLLMGSRPILPRVEGDRLMLGDAVLLAALEGSRALTAGERAALQGSPLTTRRLRTLAVARAQARRLAANDAWQGSRGMLRAADSGAALTQLATDDGFWRLHFVDSAGARRVILQLMPEAPFAAHLLREGTLLLVLDGAGSEVLEGRLDLDGECECAWPFADEPAAHFQRHGAAFRVQPQPGTNR
jgi:hypothetical protein